MEQTGVSDVNDRHVGLLENYELEVLGTRKGRGALLFETNIGTVILKEYIGYKEKSCFQEAVLSMIRDKGFACVETIVKNKEGELLTTDGDGISYILKTYKDGRECNVRDEKECILAMETLAGLHKASVIDRELPGFSKTVPVSREFEKHNKELRRVKKFLKEKGQKNDFEIYLMQCYDYFFEMALRVTAKLLEYEQGTQNMLSGIICHGDYQHHNLMMTQEGLFLINFEKCIQDSPVRDIYLFMRKLLEKNDWDKKAGFALLAAYERENELKTGDYAQLYYRMAYPEKFWKIVNFYYNSGKAWIPGKNLDKLMKVNAQEDYKKEFLEDFKQKYAIL